MKAVLVINYASEEDINKKTSIHLLNEENEWVEDVVIKPMPKQFTTDEILMAKDVKTAIEMRAYNDCLEEILGETE